MRQSLRARLGFLELSERSGIGLCGPTCQQTRRSARRCATATWESLLRYDRSAADGDGLSGKATRLRVHVHPADEQDRDSGLDLLVGADREFPRIERLWADGAYQGEFETTLGCRVTIVSASPDQLGCSVQPRRWVVERTFAHLGRYRRLAKDSEHLAECAVAHILTASIHLMLKRFVATQV